MKSPGFCLLLLLAAPAACSLDATPTAGERIAIAREQMSVSPAPDLGREVLAANDGWASLEPGTSGGTLAAPEQVYVVQTRAEFLAALNDGLPLLVATATPSNQPKIVYVSGSIDFNVDDQNLPLGCADYYRDGYSPEAFLAAYDPATWGKLAPSGALEAARISSQLTQQARVRMRVGSNTTIVGLDPRARLRGIWLDIRGTASQNVSNVIVRNLTFQDTFDCFPTWAPTDGALGSWNALYDSISLRNADHVWIDHDSFEDRATADELEPNYLGVLFQVHDGELDITNASDLVTVSWNRFRHHDKVMLIGSSDTAAADRGKLRVTLHHNLFENVRQRAPRVRFGQVHVYDNYYKVDEAASYAYSWGVGVESAIYAENNFFRWAADVLPSQAVSVFGGTSLYEAGSKLAATCEPEAVSLVEAWNALHDPDLIETPSWAPTLFTDLEPAERAARCVRERAGPR